MKRKKQWVHLLYIVAIVGNMLVHLWKRGLVFLNYSMYIAAGSPKDGMTGEATNFLVTTILKTDKIVLIYALVVTLLLGLPLLLGKIRFLDWSRYQALFLLIPFPTIYIMSRLWPNAADLAGLFDGADVPLNSKLLWQEIIVLCALYAFIVLIRRITFQRGKGKM